jgi:epoxyqueuosine reductase QueG
VAYGHLGILKRARRMCAFLKQRGYQARMGLHRKEAAVRSGLGSVGKHNLVIHPQFGSWVAYQSMVTDAPLEADAPAAPDVCGACDLCLKACPTGALYEPRRLDPGRCVTCLLTSRQVAPEHRSALGSYILGCDRCQESCPRNHPVRAKSNLESMLPGDMGMYPSLRLLLELDEKRFRREVLGHLQEKVMGQGVLARLLCRPAASRMLTWALKHLFRGKEWLPETFVHASDNLKTYQRNALIAAGNRRCGTLRDCVQRHLADEQLRPYAAWALERMGP